ncbi:MAG: RES domain-containing protein [Prevotella sp.]
MKKTLLLNAISKDMSKPLTRYDTELEYVPTQYICELCKLHGADGICFESSLKNGGLNYVLFKENDAECIAVRAVQINEVMINA